MHVIDIQLSAHTRLRQLEPDNQSSKLQAKVFHELDVK
jgi:hypothetical protein